MSDRRSLPAAAALHSFARMAAACAIVALLAPAGHAALKKYGVAVQNLTQFESTSPKVDPRIQEGIGVSLIDDSAANPILKKLIVLQATKSTIIVPQLNGFIYLTNLNTSGPINNQTGTGSTASSINWGNLPGWTITGGAYCHAVPSYICGLASLVELETTDPELQSSNYDMGLFVFHGTGFTMPDGYLSRTATDGNLGNLTRFLRGPETTDGTVPAIPMLGLAAVGISVIGAAIAAKRGRR